MFLSPNLIFLFSVSVSENLHRMYEKKHNFLIIVTTLPTSDPLRFRKILFDSYKTDNNSSDWNFKQRDYEK